MGLFSKLRKKNKDALPSLDDISNKSLETLNNNTMNFVKDKTEMPTDKTTTHGLSENPELTEIERLEQDLDKVLETLKPKTQVEKPVDNQIIANNQTLEKTVAKRTSKNAVKKHVKKTKSKRQKPKQLKHDTQPEILSPKPITPIPDKRVSKKPVSKNVEYMKILKNIQALRQELVSNPVSVIRKLKDIKKLMSNKNLSKEELENLRQEFKELYVDAHLKTLS